MSRKFKYVGPSDEVEVVYDGVVLGTVERGHQIEIDHPDASKALDGSPDWEPVKDPKKSAAAKKAAATRAETDQPADQPAESGTTEES